MTLVAALLLASGGQTFRGTAVVTDPPTKAKVRRRLDLALVQAKRLGYAVEPEDIGLGWESGGSVSVELRSKGTWINATRLTLRERDGRLLSLYDGALRSRRAPGWRSGLPRDEARRRTIAFARTVGVPAGWRLEGTSFGTVGREVWPRSAQVEFAPMPDGHPFLLGGDGARISLDPKSGAIRSYAYHDGTKLARLPVRLTPKRAVARARAERKEGTGSAVLTPPRLGWSPLGETWGGTQRLAYAVALTGETIRVDAHDGRILGRRRNR